MRQLPGRLSRLHGKRHFLEWGERTWTAVPSATRCEEKQAHCSCASSQRGTGADAMRSCVAKYLRQPGGGNTIGCHGFRVWLRSKGKGRHHGLRTCCHQHI